MNGSRSTYMRKGYLLTALAAAVLLAASSGTAQAQVTGVSSHGEGGVLVTMPSTVSEGETVTISVSVMGTVDPGDEAQEVTVTLSALDPQVARTGVPSSTAAEDNDFSLYPSNTDDDGVLTLEFPAVASGGRATVYTRRGSIELDTTYDRDAENEYVTLTVVTVSNELAGGPTGADLTKTITIDDEDTQTYTMNLRRRDTYIEGGDINVELEAEPAHVQGMGRVSLRVADEDGNRLRTYTVPDAPIVIDDEPAVVEAMVGVPSNDKNRVADTITIEALMGTAGDYATVGSVDVTVADLNMLPGASAITAVAKDKLRGGKTVAEIEEGGDPVYLTVTVDRGTSRSGITGEKLTVDITPADAAQLGDYDLSLSRIELEGQDTGKQSNDVGLELKLSALNDEDVGAEDLVLDLVVSGVSSNGASTSTGTFTIAIVDDTMAKVWPLPEAEAYPAILDAIDAAAGEDGLNPGESFTVMTSDLFGMADGYTATYRASVEGGAVSVSASSDTVRVTAGEAGESKVTITATAKMAASSFLPEQTMSDVAHITFAVMVVDEETEPVPALPLIAQLLLALFMTAGGARLYRRRQG